MTIRTSATGCSGEARTQKAQVQITTVPLSFADVGPAAIIQQPTSPDFCEDQMGRHNIHPKNISLHIFCDNVNDESSV